MKKTKIFRSVVLTMVMIMAIGSTAYAKTYSSSKKVRYVKTYHEQFYGNEGDYYACGDKTHAYMNVRNNTDEEREYTVDVRRYNYGKKKYDLAVSSTKKVSVGKSVECSLEREWDSYIYNYRHHAAAYSYLPSKALTQRILLEEYYFYAKQYYE